MRPRRSHTFKLFGKTESATAALLEDLSPDPRLQVAYRAHFPEIQITLHVDEADPAVGRDLLHSLAADVRHRLGPIVYTEDPSIGFPDAIAQVMARHPASPTVALAESCTGGLIGKMITEVPGVSAWFLEGLTTYSNAAKTRLLGVDSALLAEHGAVSEAVVRAMAEGVRRRSGARIGLATTGIAGPGGGSPDKPVGTVYIAMATPAKTTHRLLQLPFDRERNRVVTAWAALEQLRRWALS